MIVRDCLGREREPSRVWPDGSYNCPFCCYAVKEGTPGCSNPACFARVDPPFPVETAREMLAREEARQREIAERAERERSIREYHEQSRREESDRLAAIAGEARSRGACVDCAIESARWGRTPKFTRHRSATSCRSTKSRFS